MRTYKALPCLQSLHQLVTLTDEFPSGLAWRTTTRYHEAGAMAGKYVAAKRYYGIRILGDQYHAHRIVYYMRTGINPRNADVVHLKDNPEKDNRKELVLFDGTDLKIPVKNLRSMKARFKGVKP